MKKLLFLLLAFTLLSACRDKEQDPDVLPEATQSGKNTGGALVDGKIWVAKIEAPSVSGGNYTFYSTSSGTYKLEIDMSEVNNSSSRINFYINIPNDITVGNYTLSDNNIRASFSKATLDHFTTTNIYKGTLTITKFDKTSQIVSGTFNFKGINSNGQVVNITAGRFDKKFQQ